MKKSPVFLVIALVTFALLTAGCNTAPEQPSSAKKHPDTTTQYTPVGSHISKRVKKTKQEPNPDDTESQEYMRTMQNSPKFTDLNEGSGGPRK